MGLFLKSKEDRDKEREQKEAEKSVQAMKDKAEASLQKAQWEAYQARKQREEEEKRAAQLENLAAVQDIVDEQIKWELYKLRQSDPKLYELTVRPGMEELKEKFEPTRTLDYISIDENNRIIRLQPHPYAFVYLNYDEIKSYELVENNNQITQGGLGTAVAGGLLFGAAGAVAGSVLGKNAATVVENLDLLINITDINYPCIYIHYIGMRTKVESQEYKRAFQQAKEAIACLDIILETSYEEVEEVQVAEQAVTTMNPYEEIKMLKELLDIGAITQEDYDAKKKQLLGI